MPQSIEYDQRLIIQHPDSEKLYCEKIDIGNGEIREIASGL